MTASIDAKAVALIAGASAAATYLIAKRQFERKAVTERMKRYEHDQKVRFEENEERTKEGTLSFTSNNTTY